MKRWSGLILLVLIGGLAVVTAAVYAAPEDQQEIEKKGFWVESTTVDAGKVRAGEDAVAVFVFHNETEKDVKIIRAKPS